MLGASEFLADYTIMPIRFACKHCGQRLSVSSRKAGARAKCPKCKERVTIPESDSESVEEPPEIGDEQDDAAGSPYSEFVVYDDEVEWVYESDDSPSSTPAVGVTDLNRVAVPRSVLYAQGILLAVVAVASFVLGVLIGSSGKTEVADLPAQPCVVTGLVQYAGGSGQNRPDNGAIVLVVPTEERPSRESKAEVAGLRPGDPVPQDDSDNLRIIRSIGGAYTRVDADGQFHVQLPDTGRYFVLVVSGNAYRNAGQDPNRGDIAQLGRYVQPPMDLLGQSKYEWRELTIRNDEAVNVVF
ncbi:MAG: hypothetical protein CMJ64_25120 [Planctomycetaceae bacterium]|nr:hypothetical protein [Planctomycetaceae bacterium]